ncbi:hypothetical protein LCGC14_1788400 [marine sediment metagenome]|uniref:Uncharacterized protein n=1 Tax=marine sediment metagenome TaxID=412755 RepID=A0A0F9GT92_9ZZZZ
MSQSQDSYNLYNTYSTIYSSIGNEGIKMQYINPSTIECPNCGGKLRPSKLNNGKYICYSCNSIIDETEVEYR